MMIIMLVAYMRQLYYQYFASTRLLATLQSIEPSPSPSIPSSQAREFLGPWTGIPPAANLQRGVVAADGDEPDVIQAILARNGVPGPSLVFCGTLMGADLVIIACRPDGCWLLLFVQAKAGTEASTPEALRALQFSVPCESRKEPSLA